MEEEEGPMSPSLLEEVVVEESEEEEEVVVPATPPREEVEVVATSPILASQRHLRMRRGSLASQFPASQAPPAEAAPPAPPATLLVPQGAPDTPDTPGVPHTAPVTPEVPQFAPETPATTPESSSAAPEAAPPAPTAPTEAPAPKIEGGGGGESKEPLGGEGGGGEEARPRKKRKRKSEEEENEEGSNCTICFERWSNSGGHRIASLKCGHFFGQSCIEKWLRGASSCPNCNEKAARKEVRPHYVSRLAALDTGERDRALQELEVVRGQLREAQLRETELQVRLQLQGQQIERLKGGTVPVGGLGGGMGLAPPPAKAGGAGVEPRLVYQRRHELCKPSQERDKCCRVLAATNHLGMLLVSQPNTSSSNLFPGFGVRRFNLLDQRVGNYVPVMKDVLRDLAVHPDQPELLLSCGQDKTARITNVSTCTEVARFTSESEVWACDWGLAGRVYLGTKRSTVEVRETRAPGSEAQVLKFDGSERRPVIGLRHVAPAPDQGLPYPGLLVLTLGSLWYWELPGGAPVQHRLATPPGRLFSSLTFLPSSRLLLLSCRPAPTAAHIVMQLAVTRCAGT